MAAETVIEEITINSTAFAQGGDIPRKYACDGDGLNPPLQIGNLPEGTQSVALIMDDPDAPSGLFTHWIEWNIPPGAAIAENSNPGISGTGTSGKTGYHPPCPPGGRHRYYFRLYALDAALDLPAGSNRDILENAMQQHIIAQGELMGYYEQKK